MLVMLLLINSLELYSQQLLPTRIFPSVTDTLLATEDSAVYFSMLKGTEKVSPATDSRKFATSIEHSSQSGVNLSGGQISYAANYRSIIDTPYAEKNILQHNVTGQLGFSAFSLPLIATFLVRRSNSDFFRNIQDVQVSLDPTGWRTRMQQHIRQQVQQIGKSLEDSLTAKMLNLKLRDLSFTNQWLHGGFQMQRLVEANEVLNVQNITRRADDSDEKNDSREAQLKIRSKRFLDLYHKVDSIARLLSQEVDSLRHIYDKSREKADAFNKLTDGDYSTFNAYRSLNAALVSESLPQITMPSKYERLMGIRALSVGRSPLNYSELTAKNISVKGINVEYNTWYYAAFSAGLVDFRFRDFAIGRSTRKQYLVMTRLGIGRLEGNHFILSAFKGFKQLYASGNNLTGTTGIELTGLSGAVKWRVSSNTDMTGEVAQSISPDFSSQSQTAKTRFSFLDKTNKAYAVRLTSYYPRSATRVEAMYKSTGANYQSFSSFQTNSSLNSWHVKADQYLFRKTFKVAASIRTSDFSNPFVVQQYSSNTIFKSVSGSFRKRGLPMLTVGYIPFTQLISIDNQVMENRFQSLNANGYHIYHVAKTKTATTLMYNKFYNSSTDSSFVYYNASNIYLAQNIFFGSLTASVAVSDTRNAQFILQVFDENLQFNVGKFSTVTLGIKINNFNRKDVKVGGYGNANIRLWTDDMLYLSYERGYLPDLNNRAVKNDIATIQFTKVLGFSKKYSNSSL